MKTRMDYVTNSSSSNYIIAYKDVQCVPKDVTDRLNNLTTEILQNENHCETECMEAFHSMEELNQYLNDRYEYGYTLEDLIANDNISNFTAEDIQRYFDDGYTLAIKKVSYHDELIRELIAILEGTNSHFIVLNKCE